MENGKSYSIQGKHFYKSLMGSKKQRMDEAMVFSRFGEMEIIGCYLKERCQICASGQVQATVLYEDFCKWHIKLGHPPMKQKRFGHHISRLFVKEKRGVYHYFGLKIKN